nr:ribonuclease H [Frondihabitans sucicola]
MSATIIATDGSCLKNPGGPSGWAWINQDGTYRAGAIPRGTNQIAELEALLNAVRDHVHIADLTIQTDSQYALKCFTIWAPVWKRKGWKTAQGKDVANLALVRALHQLALIRVDSGLPPVNVEWVKGHANGRNPLNDAADRHAGIASRFAQATSRPQLFEGKEAPILLSA